jgi:hypothetical protein
MLEQNPFLDSRGRRQRGAAGPAAGACAAGDEPVGGDDGAGDEASFGDGSAATAAAGRGQRRVRHHRARGLGKRHRARRLRRHPRDTVAGGQRRSRQRRQRRRLRAAGPLHAGPACRSTCARQLAGMRLSPEDRGRGAGADRIAQRGRLPGRHAGGDRAPAVPDEASTWTKAAKSWWSGCTARCAGCRAWSRWAWARATWASACCCSCARSRACEVQAVAVIICKQHLELLARRDMKKLTARHRRGRRTAARRAGLIVQLRAQARPPVQPTPRPTSSCPT